MPIDNPFFYLAAVPAVLIAGVSKGGFGGGLGMLAVPLMALTVPPTQAAAILLPILCLMDLFGVGAYRRHWHRANLAILFSGALMGTALGTLTFRFLDEATLRLLLGLIALGFTLGYWFAGFDRPPAERNILKGGFWGAVSGYTSFVAHAGGLPVSIYLLPQRLNKTVFVGTMAMFFFAINYTKILPYAWLGQFATGNLATAAVLGPVAILGVVAGIRLHHRIDTDRFYRLCYAMLFVAGVKLLWDGVTGLI